MSQLRSFATDAAGLACQFVVASPRKRTNFDGWLSDDRDPLDLMRLYPRKRNVVTQITRAEAPRCNVSAL